MEALILHRDTATGLDYAGDIGETTPVSWQPRSTLDFEEWIAIGNTLQQVGASLNWWIGDWLNYGERKWGEMYAQAVETTGWDYQRLRDAKWVTSRVQLSLRKDNLTWTHHKEVAHLEPEEQAAWLNRALAHGWGTRQLREEIRGLPETIPPPSLSLSEPGESPFNHHPRTQVPAHERTAVDEYEQQPDEIRYPEKPERIYPLTAANHAVSLDPDYDGDEWYTPRQYITAARTLMGDIDLDPASCEEAQEAVCAARYLTKEDDALRDDIRWHGRVWLNPPYSTPLIRYFVAKLIAEYEAGNVTEAVILTNNSSDTGWFHDLLSRYPACFTRGRVQFWRPDSDTFGARQGQTLFYLGDEIATFVDVFSEFGQVVIKA